MSHPQPPPQASGAPAPTAESAAAVQDVAVKRDVLLEDPAEMKLTHVQETALPFGSRPFTRAEELRMGAELMQDTTNRDVKSRPGPGGKRLTYMEGWRSVDVANRVFGFNGWSSQVLSMRINVCNETSQKRWNVCISCTVRVTLKDGSFHEDRGNGSAENYKTESEAIMLAEKEAVTDARKRALKNFGRRLGLSLYSDEHLRNLASEDAAKREREKEARLLKARLMQEQLKQSREEAKQQARHQPLPLIRAMFTAAQPHQPAGQQPQCVAASPARHASIGMSPVTPAAAPNGQPTASADCRAGTPVRLLPLPIGRPASSPANLAAVGQKRPPPLPGVPPAAKLARTGGLRAAKGGHGQFAAASSLPTGGTCRREEKSTAGSDEEERELLALFAADAIE